tara:strand:- start:54 stop:230 length:177 start_codon:yes stop_codon:yes gene_type:complete
MDYLIENWAAILSALTSIVGGFSILATLTPNEADNMLVDKLMKMINLLGANLGKAKNA